MASFNLTEFQSSLLPASYNGAFFFVLDTTLKSGQRVAEHVFPFRDIPYSEPLGKQVRTYRFTGFVVGGAGDLQGQYAAMLAAIETGPKPGTLVHPVFGQLQVIPVDVEFEQSTAGRYVEIRFSFVEAGQIIYPSTGADTQADTINAAASSQTTSQSSFSNNVGGGGNAPLSAGEPPPLPSASDVNPDLNADAGIPHGSQDPAAISMNNTGDQVLQAGATDFQ